MGIPSSPDDAATASTSESKSDRVCDSVYRIGRTWRLSCNVKRSAVLVYGEHLETFQRSHDLRHFELGPDRIHERCEYDHVRVII